MKRKTYKQYSLAEKQTIQRNAERLFYSCKSHTKERINVANCMECVLQKAVKSGQIPNVSGWERIFIEAKIELSPIQVYAILNIKTDNEAYKEALKESISNFGIVIK